MDTTATGLLTQYERLRADTSGMHSLWQEVSRMTLVRKVSALTAAINRTPGFAETFSPYEAALVNTTAVECVDIHAAGSMSWILPSDGRWFKFSPQREFATDEVEAWLSDCTDITLLWLAASNFYSKAHELMIDRCVTGTATLTCEAGKSSPLNFRVFDPGSFIIQDNEEGEADALWRERQLTARQAVELFGSRVSSKVRSDAEGQTPNRLHRFLQVVYPRPMAERNRPGNAGYAFAEKWIEVSEKSEVAESGFNEQPFFANRYLRWSEYSPWGVSPAMLALAEVKGVNYLDLLYTTHAETQVNPRIIMNQGNAGVPDLRPGGITYGGLDRSAYPEEWMTGGRLDFAASIMERKERVIRSIFHAQLFDQFSQIEREITATEVRAREAEKVARFSPAFTQLTTELLNPLLRRVFMLLYRQGAFPQPPASAFYQEADGQSYVSFPRIVHTSRMALAIAALRKTSFADLLAIYAPLAAAGSPVLDNINEDESFRDMARNDGLPESYLRTEEQREEMRAKRAQAMRAAEQAEMAREMMKSNPIATAGVEMMKGVA